MSYGADGAYRNGEMPLSKWSKAQFLDQIESLGLANFADLKKLTVKELKFYCLDQTSWHHTGKYFNETNFYSLKDKDALEALDVNAIILSRPKRVIERKPKQPKVPNLYISAWVTYNNWEGSRNYPKLVSYEEIVQYRSNDKLVWTNCGRKRLSSLTIHYSATCKHGYSDKAQKQLDKEIKSRNEWWVKKHPYSEAAKTLAKEKTEAAKQVKVQEDDEMEL